DDQPTYFNDFYMLTITLTDLTWERIPQDGHIPCPRQGHSLRYWPYMQKETILATPGLKHQRARKNVVKGKIYLFGGCSSQNAEYCLPGVYVFDLDSLTWQKITTSGLAPQTLEHSSAVVGENIFVYGGMENGKAVDDLYTFNTVSHCWTPVKTFASNPGARFPV
ncbi:putative Acyl-CoA-binding domain-containing protein, partial [Naja naja]